eukprot:PLAT3662.22.p1 GENE.PLAT3662.22~~PLAT3662.22.p1  ORF type:complete len:573 (+),score=237.13 PLAT3662.22:91-1809(+)
MMEDEEYEVEYEVEVEEDEDSDGGVVDDVDEDSKGDDGEEEAASKQPCVLLYMTGCRGDVMPFIALAGGLLDVGCDVHLVTNGVWRDDEAVAGVMERGATLTALPGNPEETILYDESMAAALKAGEVMKLTTAIADLSRQHAETNMTTLLQAVRAHAPNVIAFSPRHCGESVSLCQRLQLTPVMLSTYPVSPSADLPVVSSWTVETGGRAWMNSAAHWVSLKAEWFAVSASVNLFRKKLGLRPMHELPFDKLPQIAAFSAFISPRPWDWCASIRQIGSLAVDDGGAAYEAEGKLADMMGGDEDVAGDSIRRADIVAISFGSVPLSDPATLLAALGGALSRTGCRGVLCARWSAPLRGRDVPDNIVVAPFVPHSWLFARVAAVLHHGGAGTTTAAARAGCPQVVYPVAGDQRFWATRVVACGVAPPDFVPFHELAEDNLGRYLKYITTEPGVRRAADELAGDVASEDAVDSAVDVLLREAAFRPHVGIKCEWMPDSSAPACMACGAEFGVFLPPRRHHCRSCGGIFCGDCLALADLPGYCEQAMACQTCFTVRQQFLAAHPPPPPKPRVLRPV